MQMHREGGEGEVAVGTHLDGAALPGVDGGLAFPAEEVGLALCELGAKYLCVAARELVRVRRVGARVELEAVLGLGLEDPLARAAADVLWLRHAGLWGLVLGQVDGRDCSEQVGAGVGSSSKTLNPGCGPRMSIGVLSRDLQQLELAAGDARMSTNRECRAREKNIRRRDLGHCGTLFLAADRERRNTEVHELSGNSVDGLVPGDLCRWDSITEDVINRLPESRQRCDDDEPTAAISLNCVHCKAPDDRLAERYIELGAEVFPLGRSSRQTLIRTQHADRDWMAVLKKKKAMETRRLLRIPVESGTQGKMGNSATSRAQDGRRTRDVDRRADDKTETPRTCFFLQSRAINILPCSHHPSALFLPLPGHPMPSSRNSSDLDSEKVKEAASDIGVDAKHPAVYDKTVVDTAAVLVAGTEGDVDPQEAARLRRKLDWHLMPLMCILYLMTFADKTTLGQSAILGIKQGAHLNQNQFNWLGAVFYLSYLVFQYPQNLALQYFPIGKWISINVLVWAIALMCHAACHSFGALFAVRFIMGMAEGAITPGFMLVTAMFYTRAEQTKRVGYWYLMNGVAIIVLGFLGFGVLHIHTGKFLPWQWLVIITGIMTLIVAVCFWLFFPDSPTTAWFLTPEERVTAVQRIRVNQAGVENKVWKRDQAIETLKDPKTWIFAVFAAVTNLLNSLTNQRQIIVNEFGFNTINTTLIGCVDGLVEIVAIWIAVTVASAWPNGRIYAAVLCFIPSIVGSVLVSVLPFHLKGGLLVSYWLSSKPYLLPIAKTLTEDNHVPWGIFTGVCVASAVLLLLARWLLARENTRRELEKHDDTFDEVYIAAVDKDGKAVEKHVDRVRVFFSFRVPVVWGFVLTGWFGAQAFLDLTDRQNRDFRYPL
ncbi:hypothetical protein EVG20_g1640 [Dentipellis fragilis]|uniref:Major facilitator superfamily (MFS) profile domain-containing protein n=1 Tax=Dentipellis fragilis TaxID=205917 RepID=A0A4Y9ZBK4_9AGAM|nr:hypothetical protein EVG20_g1640 [Dentipellis fragilis]